MIWRSRDSSRERGLAKTRTTAKLKVRNAFRFFFESNEKMSLSPFAHSRKKKLPLTKTVKEGKMNTPIVSLLAAIELELSNPVPSLVRKRERAEEWRRMRERERQNFDREKKGGAPRAAAPFFEERLVVFLLLLLLLRSFSAAVNERTKQDRRNYSPKRGTLPCRRRWRQPKKRKKRK